VGVFSEQPVCRGGGAHVSRLARAIQLALPLRGIAQTVLLTKGHCSKPKNSRYSPKFSEAV
jgi:hypothetical protein